MSDRVRIFTVAEANALLPRLNVILGRQMEELRAIEAASEALRARGGDPRALDPTPGDDPRDDPGDDPETAALKADLRARGQRFQEGWTEVEALGAVVKDVRQGLLDFYGRRAGQLVWLCWKYGEPAVAHWHPLDQGFATRQPLERVSIPPTLN
jgi:hypothetical protein